MLGATFVGHQGWLLTAGGSHVLVDPLLSDGFGHGGLAGTVFPPRHVDLERMPELDAVWLTHEHDDHFDLPSLSRLDRSIPIHVSSRSSGAMCDALTELGFCVERVEPGAVVALGELSMRTFVADHRATPLADEWDVLPLVATDAAGHGAFASSVDVAMPDALLDAVAAMRERRWLLCLANNTTDVRFVRHGVGRLEPSDDTAALAGVLTRRWQHAAARAGRPAFTAITGGGWSHPDDVAWIDRVAFCIDSQRLAASLRRSCSAPVCAVRPGAEITLTPEGLRHGEATWVRTVAEASRPAPSAVVVPDDVGPACGRRQLRPEEWGRLEAGLSELARYLFARGFFVAAHSHVSSRRPLGLALRDDADERVYAWQPSSTGFERIELADPIAAFDAGLRLWGTDLLDLFEGALAPSAICYTGRVRCWNHEPERLRIDPGMLWLFAHPLHRPEAARRLYARLSR